ncbi:AraC family transcriptional regulator [Cuneatibacter sp. NSJ-177]|uniref:AraC family transcriptional regulator n=1 Tax=Cuneatibacter sp. NSJ-177 TaxID=2931401 RepID=UPI001FD5D59D|nr:AraC family transcriptional regulator [Cuneatibacter sp. NSJ-177]MCJ7835775.1 AraC family transcriptional regulator [Cuneatibacter sp. NSJ-177]
MTLLELCREITDSASLYLQKEHPLGSRLICPEYSKSVQEIKTHPFPEQEPVFALCWNLHASSKLSATLYPAPEPFSYHFSFVPGEKTQLHTHDYIELAYIVEGEFHQKILGKKVVFQKGELCLIDKNCLHQDYLLAQNSIIVFLGITNNIFTELMNDATAIPQKIHAFLHSALLKQKDIHQYLHFKPNDGAVQDMEECLVMLLTELSLRNTGYKYICRGLLFRILHTLSIQYDFSLSQEYKNAMNWVIFEEISSYIQQNCDTVTIQQLVEIFHFQADYFNRLIKRKTGLTYSYYLQQVRLNRAEQLLLHTDCCIDEIMECVGYHNKGYFYKIFQKHFGMTPGKYREQNQLEVQKA